MSFGFKFRKFIYEARLSLDTIVFHIIGCLALIYFVGDMNNGYIYMDPDGTINGWLYCKPILLANLVPYFIYILSRAIFPDYRNDSHDFGEVVWSGFLGVVSCVVASNVIDVMDDRGNDNISIAIAIGHTLASWLFLYAASNIVKLWYGYKRDKEKFPG